MTVRHLRN